MRTLLLEWTILYTFNLIYNSQDLSRAVFSSFSLDSLWLSFKLPGFDWPLTGHYPIRGR